MTNKTHKSLAAEAAFLTLESRAELLSELRKPKTDNAKISFQELWNAAQDPLQYSDIINRIYLDASALRQFEALLQRLNQGYMGAQIAAGSENMSYRKGDGFDLELTMSSRGDGAYIRVIFHQTPQVLPKHLYYRARGSFNFLEMTSINERTMQILIETGNLFFEVYQDPAMEFWVK